MYKEERWGPQETQNSSTEFEHRQPAQHRLPTGQNQMSQIAQTNNRTEAHMNQRAHCDELLFRNSQPISAWILIQPLYRYRPLLTSQHRTNTEAQI